VAGADGPPMTAQKAPKRQGGVSECHQAGESGATALFGASRDESKAASEGRLVCHIGGWRPMAKTDGLNARLHWAVRAKRTTLVHDITTGAMTLAGWPRSLPGEPSEYVITFTVTCKRPPLPDSDNLAGWMKATRDSVAKWLNVPDDMSGPTWMYRAVRGPEDSTLIDVERR
jgi:hypothetical protein